ncbi:uncharacterized protein [Diadema antillarum]|uniref:uncharacterized protein n=1 Tax=Diadema antillarum TaxID=105358 RepID=UPI003A88CD88
MTDPDRLRGFIRGAIRDRQLCFPGLLCQGYEVLPRREFTDLAREQHAIALRRGDGEWIRCLHSYLRFHTDLSREWLHLYVPHPESNRDAPLGGGLGWGPGSGGSESLYWDPSMGVRTPFPPPWRGTPEPATASGRRRSPPTGPGSHVTERVRTSQGTSGREEFPPREALGVGQDTGGRGAREAVETQYFTRSRGGSNCPPGKKTASTKRASRARKRRKSQGDDGHPPKARKKLCPVAGCMQRSGRVKWHVYAHMPPCFRRFPEGQYQPENTLPRVACLRFLAQTLVGTPDLAALVRFVDQEWEGPIGEVSTDGLEDISALAREMGWPCPQPILLRPLGSWAALAHWRVLAFLYSRLTPEERQEFHHLGGMKVGQGGEPATGSGRKRTPPATVSRPPSPSVDPAGVGHPSAAQAEAPSAAPVREVPAPQGTPPPRAEASADGVVEMEGVVEGMEIATNPQSTEAEGNSGVESHSAGPSTPLPPVGPEGGVLGKEPVPDAVGVAGLPANSPPASARTPTYAATLQAPPPPPKAPGNPTVQGGPAVKPPNPGGAAKQLSQAFDSHFHLDRLESRTGRKGIGAILATTGRPTRVPVKVVGGVLNYCDPQQYNRIFFPVDSMWKVAVGIHPKKAPNASASILDRLQALICDPRVSAISELGLDFSCPPKTFKSQEGLLDRILRMGVSGRVLVLHMRGDTDLDPAGTQPSRLVRAALKKHCSRHQRVHIHCCQLTATEAVAWRKAFPHAYFSYNASVSRLGADQRKALAGVPLNRLLLETDSPHLSPDREVPINTPAYIGEVAARVAEVRQEAVALVIGATKDNALRLYGHR